MKNLVKKILAAIPILSLSLAPTVFASGNITVKGSLLLSETAKVIGNISCSSLGMREGAYFSGACKMTEPKTEASIPNVQ